MRQTVVGVFDRFASAQQAADLLKQRGIDASDIQITGTGQAGDTPVRAEREESSLLDRIRNFFSGTTDDDVEVSAYSEAVRRGGAVVKVQVEDEPRIELAREALESAGAVDIDERMSEWRASGWSPPGAGGTASSAAAGTTTVRTAGTAAGATPAKKGRKKAAAAGSAATTATTASSEADQVIPVVREEVQVGKRTVKAGGVRVYSHLVEEQVNESVDLREERARVERRPADRPVSESEMQSLGERSVEIEETVERPVVQKTARVVEEVVVGKDVRQKTADVHETVRHTEVDVTDLGTRGSAGGRTFEDFNSDFRSDFGTRYGNSAGERYEDYEPAYRHGYTLAGDTRYQDRDWDSLERDARSDWERQHPGSPWEKVKAAARHAWERARR